MGTENETEIDTRSESDAQAYPFGLSSRQLFALVVLVGLIGSGLSVYTLEQANLSTVADLVWIIGYGTTVFVVWIIWIRPLDFTGSSAHDTTLSDETDQSETGSTRNGSESSGSVESPAQESTSTTETTS